MDNKQKALCKYFMEVESYSVREAVELAQNWEDQSYNEDYMVLTDDEADQKARDYIEDSVWAFRASFILSECGLDLSGAESLEEMQGKSCEGANDFILSLIEKTCGLDSFVDSAISADGRGLFISSYDGEENEQKIDDEYYYIYRVN